MTISGWAQSRRQRSSGAGSGSEQRRRRRLSAGFLFLLLGAGLSLLSGTGPASAQDDNAQDDQARVLVTTVDDTITPVIADHLDDVVDRGENDEYDAVVVEIDTPGGLVDSMRQIVQRFLAAEVPVVVYVTPEGARAASAGAMITFAGNVAAMAPSTVIGAATPVNMDDSGEASDSDRKAINDMAALAESIAETRDRNVEFAVDTVREGRSATVTEAVELGAVDLEVASLDELLQQIDGQTVTVGEERREVVLNSADAQIDSHDLGLFREIQQFLADPTLAFLFMSIGTLALIYELANPGLGGAGIVGAVCIILALVGLAVLPVNIAGVLLMVVAFGFFVAELFAPGIGIAAASGAVALALSGIFLFRDTPGLGEVSLAVILPVAIVIGGAVVVASTLVMRIRRTTSKVTGKGMLVGHTVDVQNIEGTTGWVFVEGAWWSASNATNGELVPGPADVIDVDGLTLVVQQHAPTGEPPSPTVSDSNERQQDREVGMQ